MYVHILLLLTTPSCFSQHMYLCVCVYIYIYVCVCMNVCVFMYPSHYA